MLHYHNINNGNILPGKSGKISDDERARIMFSAGYIDASALFSGSASDLVTNITQLEIEAKKELSTLGFVFVDLAFELCIEADTYSNYGTEDNSIVLIVREETDEEWKERVAKAEKRRAADKKRKEREKKQKLEARKRKEEKERRQYERLKAKYGENDAS